MASGNFFIDDHRHLTNRQGGSLWLGVEFWLLNSSLLSVFSFPEHTEVNQFNIQISKQVSIPVSLTVELDRRLLNAVADRKPLPAVVLE